MTAWCIGESRGLGPMCRDFDLSSGGQFVIYFWAEGKMDSLIITGWGWKEYAVAAAIALRAVKGRAEVMGMSKRRLPEFLEGCGRFEHIFDASDSCVFL